MNQKISFWTYFQTLNWGMPIRDKTTPYSSEFSGVSMIMLYGIFIWLGRSGIPFSCIVAFVCLPSIFLYVNLTRRRPSLYPLMPIGKRRKIVFFFLSILFTILLSLLSLAVFSLFIILVFSLITFVSTGNGVLDIHDTEFVERTICLQGHLLALSLLFCIAGMCLLIASIEKKSLRRVMTLLIPILIGVPLRILMEVAKIPSGELFVSFNAIPNNYIFLLVFAAIGVALTIVGAVKVSKLLMPKKY